MPTARSTRSCSSTCCTTPTTRPCCWPRRRGSPPPWSSRTTWRTACWPGPGSAPWTGWATPTTAWSCRTTTGPRLAGPRPSRRSGSRCRSGAPSWACTPPRSPGSSIGTSTWPAACHPPTSPARRVESARFAQQAKDVAAELLVALEPVAGAARRLPGIHEFQPVVDQDRGAEIAVEPEAVKRDAAEGRLVAGPLGERHHDRVEHGGEPVGGHDVVGEEVRVHRHDRLR